MRKKEIKINKTVNILSNQKGMALLTTLIFVFILVTFAVTLLTMTSNDTKLSALQRDSTEAFYIAEAGIEKAFWYLNTSTDNGGYGLNWRTNGVILQEPYPVVESTNYYQVTVEDNTNPTGTIIITSKGVVFDGNKVYGSRKIEVKAKKGISPVSDIAYNYAIATESDLTFNGNVQVFGGDVHANENINISGEGTNIYVYNGDVTASGETNEYSPGNENKDIQIYPKIDFDYYKQEAEKNDGLSTITGTGYYGDNTSVVFNTDTELHGIHFIDGDVEIKANLDIIDGGIFATGEIKVTGQPTINRTQSDDYDNPLAIIAKGDITLGGNVYVEGVIQTEGVFTINGSITVYNGAVVADEGFLNGGAGGINITYDPDLLGANIPGTGIPVWVKTSWREAY
jgi:Tfp pilus assembly protein PilX